MRALSRPIVMCVVSVVVVLGAGVAAASQPAGRPAALTAGEAAVAGGSGAQAGPTETPDRRGTRDAAGPTGAEGTSGSATSAAGGQTTRPSAAAAVPESSDGATTGAALSAEAGADPAAPAAAGPDVPFPDDMAGPVPGAGTWLDGCPVFPADNAWNTDVSGYPVHPNSANYIANILGNGTYLHPDFGSYTGYGIPFVVTHAGDPLVPVVWEAYGDESDPGPYRIPLTAPIEGGSGADGDRHAIGVDVSNCRLYELYRAFPIGGAWHADSGTSWDLRSNDLRPEGWTSADAAGLPIFPGLARYDEVASGEVTHALRFTVVRSQRAHILPATHNASSSTDPNRPPMGLRLRLKASYDISHFTGQSRVILEALKTHGMIVADNGSSWYISGASDSRWDDDDLNQMKSVPGSAFEAVYTGATRY